MLTEPRDEEQIIARVAALDIGKAELVCCVRVPGSGASTRRLQEVTTHATMSRALTELANYLIDLGIERVVMEATSDYWKPVFYLLEAHGLDPWMVNARDVKHLPGRPKTDVRDAVWLCKVAERQMLRASFVPPRPIRQLRDLTRCRSALIAARTAEKNRVEKLLEDACIKLSVVASDIFGVSGREMMDALIAGQHDPKVLAQKARSRMRTKLGRLEEALNGHFDDHHGFLLARMHSGARVPTARISPHFRISVGVDVHARSVVACGLDGDTGELFERRLPPDRHGIFGWIRTLPDPAAVTYEAGPTGFGLARFLLASGIECLVAAPSKLQRPAGDRVKTDKRDARQFGTAAASGSDRGGNDPRCRAGGRERSAAGAGGVRRDLMSARHRV
nr:transposase [Rhodococcus sp. WAY2]